MKKIGFKLMISLEPIRLELIYYNLHSVRFLQSHTINRINLKLLTIAPKQVHTFIKE